eukprot:TRINITY_DN2156_c0_g3_i1.p1 TRINITY_DN2156_c0_g3~~TRINITY_DN2156_c0_g3_i1.p1  ORF type:complete len:249 (+),score=26.70 TRINITY_DN2156_c0_g3_i1:376-1122(+)
MQSILKKKRELNKLKEKKEAKALAYDYRGRLINLAKSRNLDLPNCIMKSSFDVNDSLVNGCKAVCKPRYTSELMSSPLRESAKSDMACKVARLLIKPARGVKCFVSNSAYAGLAVSPKLKTKRDLVVACINKKTECKLSQKKSNNEFSHYPAMYRRVARRLRKYFNDSNISQSFTIPSQIHTYDSLASTPHHEIGVKRDAGVLPNKLWRRLRLCRAMLHRLRKSSVELKDCRKLPPPPLGFSCGHGIC